jgi:NAD(P)-dependent dehydrogenase (short-subunit alcohol dehydrogenase family)
MKRRVLVIGASSGIGRSIANAAAAANCRVALVARRESLLEQVLQECGGDGIAITADVSSERDCERLASKAAAELGALDAVFYSAGVSPLVPTGRLTADAWLPALRINAIGASLAMKACIPHMSPAGVIAYLSSTSLGKKRHGGIVYQASKAAMEEALVVLRVEHPSCRFVNVRLGATVGTDLARDRDPALAELLAPEWAKRALLGENLMHATPLGHTIFRMIEPALDYPSAYVTEIQIEESGSGPADASKLAGPHPDPQAAYPT